MAVATFTAWVDSTAQTVLGARCKVTAIEVNPHPRQSATVYLQLFNSAGPTPGVTVPDFVFPINSITLSGAGTLQQADGIAYGSLKKRKFIFPGGLLFGTACTIFVGTAAAGGTAPTTTALPGAVKVTYTVGS